MVNIKTLPDRIIFDGHADTAKECETITLMCDGLACNNNFRTVAYRKGYAEFEKVGIAKELKFVPDGKLHIYSNDGLSELFSDSEATTHLTWTVTSTGLESNYEFDPPKYTYSGSKKFIGFAIAANTKTIRYAIGDTFFVESGTIMNLYIVEEEPTPKVSIDVTTLSGYESLPAGTYALAVKSKATNYQDSDLSQTVSFTKLAAPVATAADTTVTWDAITNAESYDVYVDGELYENTTGAIEYNVTIQGVNGGYISDGTTAAFVKVNSDTVSSTNYDFMFSSRSTASHSVKASKIALLGGDTIPDSDYSLDGTNYTELSGTTPTVIPITQDCTIYVKTYQVE